MHRYTDSLRTQFRLQEDRTTLLAQMIDTFHLNFQREVATKAKIFHSFFPSGISMATDKTVDINGKTAPVLQHGKAELNLDFTLPDKYTALTGVTATVFDLSAVVHTFKL